MMSWLRTCLPPSLTLIAGWCLISVTHRGQPWTPALILRHMRYGLSALLMAVLETVAELPGLASSCTMQCCKGLLTAFGVGFTPHIQRQTRTDLRLRPHPVDTLSHL